MARYRSLRVAALNVAFADERKHDPTWYIRLFRALYNLGQPVRVQGDRRVTIGSLIEEGRYTFVGVLDRYTEIEAGRWYNRNKRRRATKEEMGRIVVPSDMAANFQDFYYLFDAEAHIFAFLSAESGRKLSVHQAHKLLSVLADERAVRREFGTVAISIEQEPSSIERILNAEHLRYLSIMVNRPNSFGVFDRRFKDKLADMRAAKQRYELWADDSGSLAPPRELRDAAKVATSNGLVEGKIYENGAVHELSTEDSPVLQMERYDPKKTSAVLAFKNAASALINRLKRHRAS